MAVRQILGTDTLESGFRQKYNETVGEIIVSCALNEDGNIVLTKSNGNTFIINVSEAYYTKGQINEITGVGIASDSDLGITQIATEEEVTEGIDGFKYVTPATLKASGGAGGGSTFLADSLSDI